MKAKRGSIRRCTWDYHCRRPAFQYFIINGHTCAYCQRHSFRPYKVNDDTDRYEITETEYVVFITHTE